MVAEPDGRVGVRRKRRFGSIVIVRGTTYLAMNWAFHARTQEVSLHKVTLVRNLHQGGQNKNKKMKLC